MRDTEGRYNKIIRQLSERFQARVEQIQKQFEVPIGKEYMTPGQVKARYGLGVRQIEEMRKLYGPQAVDEALKLLDRGG